MVPYGDAAVSSASPSSRCPSMLFSLAEIEKKRKKMFIPYVPDTNGESDLKTALSFQGKHHGQFLHDVTQLQC